MKKSIACLLVGLVAITNSCLAADDGIKSRQEVMAYQRTLATPDFSIHYSTSEDVSEKYGKPSREGKIDNPAPRGFEDSYKIVWYFDAPNQTAVYVFHTSAGRAVFLEDRYTVPTAKYVATQARGKS